MRRRSAGNAVPGGNEKHVRPIDLKTLIGRLNELCRKALIEDASGLAASRGHYDIEIERLLFNLLNRTDSELAAILATLGQSIRFASGRSFNRSLGRLRTGNARAPGLSPDIVDMMQGAWLVASVEQDASRMRSGHLIQALLSDDKLARRLEEAAPSLAAIDATVLRRDYAAICGGTPEAAPATSHAAGSEAAATGGRRAAGRVGALDQFTLDLTGEAATARSIPSSAATLEIRQVIDILTRRRQNNPILTGEAGVGKTAVVEGLALRIVAGDVPRPLKNVSLRTLDLGLLQAGAGVKGEFENRLKSVIEEVKPSPTPIILFIDEAHTLIGAGGAAGQGDAANLLKPALARGELRTIAATTWAEYKKYFEKDAGVDTPVPGGEGRGAERSDGGRACCAASCAIAGKASRRAHSRRSGDRSRATVGTATSPAASCRTRRSACSTRRAPASRSSQAATPGAVEDCRRRIDADRDRARDPRTRDRRPAPITDEQRRRADAETSRELTNSAELKERWSRKQATRRAEIARICARGDASLAAERGRQGRRRIGRCQGRRQR